MTWRDRVQDCVYTSPSGVAFTLQFEDVKRKLKKKTTAFEFVGSDDVYVQDNGVGINTYPITIYFSGDDYDIEANEFFEALSESGNGTLQHPTYGTKTVNVVGSPEQSDRLKSGGNQAAFDLEFIETITELYPNSQTNQEFSAQSSSDEFNSAMAGEFSDSVIQDTVSESQSLKEKNLDLLGSYKETLSDISKNQQETLSSINASFNSINNGIDTLIGEPLTLAFQSIQMVKTVTNSTALVKDKLSAYGDLLSDITGVDMTQAATYNGVGVNNVITSDMYAASSVSAMADSIVNSEFDTREFAFERVATLSENFDQYLDWKFRNYDSVGKLDTGASYQKLQEQVSIVSGFIIELAASLKRQRSVILDRDYFLLDFANKYFGSTDNDTIEQVITLNSLNNSEIFTLPKGKLMRYYVE